MSLTNHHRYIILTRCSKVLETAYPVWEFKRILSCMHDPMSERRANKEVVPFFRAERRGMVETKKTKSCAPLTWAVEYNKLPNLVRTTIGTKFFQTNLKKYLLKRCQHQEHTRKVCPTCKNDTTGYIHGSCTRREVLSMDNGNTDLTIMEWEIAMERNGNGIKNNIPWVSFSTDDICRRRGISKLHEQMRMELPRFNKKRTPKRLLNQSPRVDSVAKIRRTSNYYFK